MIPLTPISVLLLLGVVASILWAKEGATTPEVMVRLLVPIFILFGLAAFVFWKYGSSFPNMMVDRIRQSLWFLPKRTDKDSDV